MILYEKLTQYVSKSVENHLVIGGLVGYNIVTVAGGHSYGPALTVFHVELRAVQGSRRMG